MTRHDSFKLNAATYELQNQQPKLSISHACLLVLYPPPEARVLIRMFNLIFKDCMNPITG